LICLLLRYNLWLVSVCPTGHTHCLCI